MFHIVGVAHRAQAQDVGDNPLTEDQERLRTLLLHLVAELKPSLIAEEQSLEALGGNRSIPQQVAQGAAVEHRFCDPDSKQRDAMKYRNRQEIGVEIFMSDEGWSMSSLEIDAKAGAIEIAHYFPMREQFWLERLEDAKDRVAIFVCGDGHVETFVRLLDNRGIASRIVERGLGLNDEDRETFGRAVRYLTEHPELQ